MLVVLKRIFVQDVFEGTRASAALNPETLSLSTLSLSLFRRICKGQGPNKCHDMILASDPMNDESNLRVNTTNPSPRKSNASHN